MAQVGSIPCVEVAITPSGYITVGFLHKSNTRDRISMIKLVPGAFGERER
jgi:hypothetical protein